MNRPFSDHRNNVDALLALLRNLMLPVGYTGRVTMTLHFHAGELRKGGYGLDNLSMGEVRVVVVGAPANGGK